MGSGEIMRRRGFTLIEVMIALAMFSSASVVIFSVFISNHNRIEAQGRETFLQESIDSGIARLTDRMKGTTEVLEVGNGVDFLIKFKYYYRDNDSEIEGKLYLEEEDGQKVLKLHNKKGGVEETRFLMKYIDDFEVELLDENGNITTVVGEARSLFIKYNVSTKYRRIRMTKNGNTVVEFKNVH